MSSRILSTNRKGGLCGSISIIFVVSIKGGLLKSMDGALFFILFLINVLICFAKSVFILCPGFVAIILPCIGIPINARSPKRSSNLWRAASFEKLSGRSFKIPSLDTDISFFPLMLSNKSLSFLVKG